MMRTDPAVSLPRVSLEETLRRARAQLSAFEGLMSEVPYDNEGIPMSEMFFLLCALGGVRPERLLESGRGGGQSTLVLGHYFKQSAVISIEENDRSPNAALATKRLAHLANVQCRFGDSRRLLPGILEAGDVVLIDGPKEFRALALAFELLRTGRPQAVFIHDLHVDSPARTFLDRHVPQAFYSDEPEFVTRFSYLDTLHGATRKAHWTREDRRGYGPTLACLPPDSLAGKSYEALSGQLKMARIVSHAHDKIRTVFGGKS